MCFYKKTDIVFLLKKVKAMHQYYCIRPINQSG